MFREANTLVTLLRVALAPGQAVPKAPLPLLPTPLPLIVDFQPAKDHRDSSLQLAVGQGGKGLATGKEAELCIASNLSFP